MNKRQTVQLVTYVSSGLSALVWITVAVLFLTRPTTTGNVAANPSVRPNPATTADPDSVSVARPAFSSDVIENDPLAEQPAQVNAVAMATSTPTIPQGRAYDRLLEQKFPYSDLPDGVLNAAFDSATSDLLVVGAHDKQLAIYRADQIGYQDAKPALVPLDGKPTAVAVKLLDDKRLYVVATIDPTLLVMIDAESKNVVRQVALQVPQLKIWGNLNKDDPQIVMAPFNSIDLSDFDSRKGQINPFKHYGSANATQYDLRAMQEGASLKGSIVSVASRESKKNVLMMPLDNSKTTLQMAEISSDDKLTVTSARSPWPEKLLPRILGDVVAMGQRVTTHDLNEELGIAEFYPKTQMNNTNLIAGNYGHIFRIASTVPLESLFELDLPDDWKVLDDPRRNSYQHRETEMFSDPRLMQFVVLLPNKVVAIPLAKAGIQQRGSLQLVLDGETSVLANQKLELKVLGRPVLKQLSIVDAPDGMTLEDDKLVWTPSSGQSGLHTCTLSHRDGDRQHQQSWSLLVRRPGIDLPLIIRYGGLAPDGKLGVFSGLNPDPEDTQWRWATAIVDLESAEVLKFEKHIELAAVRFSEGMIFVRGQQGLQVYDRETFEAIPVSTRVVIRDWTDLTSGELQKLESILSADPQLEQVTNRELIDRDGPAGQTAFGNIVKGVLRDADTHQPLLLGAYNWMRKLQKDGHWDEPFLSTDDVWHPYHDDSVRFLSSRELGIVKQHLSSPDRFAVKMTNQRLMLQMYSLGSPEIVAEAVLSETAALQGTSGRRLLDPPGETLAYDQGYTSLFVGPKRIYVARQSRLMIVERSEFPAPQSPFHIVPRQSVFEIPATGSVEVNYESAGASTFQLTALGKSKLTSTDGHFQLDMDEIIGPLIEFYLNEALHLFRSEVPREGLVDAFRLSRQGYKDAMGKETTDVPLFLPVQIVAENAASKKAYLGHDYLVLVPEKAVFEMFEQAKKKKK